MPQSYRSAGVDIDAGNELVRRIAPLAKATTRPGVLGGIGGFGAFFEVPQNGMQRPLLVSSTDGAGTKVMVAQACRRYDTIGIDAVAMCVNDVVTCGAEPLFFLDYFVAGRLDVDVAEKVIAGVAEGCRRAGCALVGGETAEHPGHMEPGSFDLAGFSVGVVDAGAIVDGSRVSPGDVVVGLGSSGIHSNGMSLARRIIADCQLSYESRIQDFGRTLGEELLEPTVIYVRPVLELHRHVPILALAHITGGGLVENIPRVLPDGLGVDLIAGSWPIPAVFSFLARQGGVAPAEMHRTYNMGLGMVAIMESAVADKAVDILKCAGVPAWVVGEVSAHQGVRVGGKPA